MLDAGGEYAFRIRGEEHMWTPDAIAKLQHATRSGKYETYKEYAKIINDQTKRHLTLRGLFEFKPQGAPVPLEEVESGQGNRQAFRHWRHVARLDLDRSAHHAGHCHEPHRRQVEHR
jgi:glutamate synthase domain-containing protein 2